MASDLACAYLLLQAARGDSHRLLTAQYFVERRMPLVETNAELIENSRPEDLDALSLLAEY